MSDLPTGKGGGPSPFVNAFDHPQLNSLRYNTSMAGSPLHLCYGTQRVTVNLLEFWGFSGSGGGKGGKGLGSSGGKKGSNQQYSVDVAFGVCQGPVAFEISDGGDALRIWANGGVAAGLGAVGLNGYAGDDGQAPDPVFASSDTNTPVIGYSETAYVTGTPLQLGSSPALPKFVVRNLWPDGRHRRPGLPARRAPRPHRHRPLDQSALRRRFPACPSRHRRQHCRLGHILP